MSHTLLDVCTAITKLVDTNGMNITSFSNSSSAHSDSTNSETLFFDAGSYFNSFLHDIHQASNEIILETYIFTLDSIGQQILTALHEAVERGVYVKLLIDGVGSSKNAKIIAASLEHHKAEVRIYHPLPWNFSAYRWAMKHENILIKCWRFIIEINHRDHRKLCIVDERIAWLGSFNITEGSTRRRHETAARLTGESVRSLKQNFFHVWQQKDRPSPLNFRHFLSNHSLKYRQQKNNELIKRIKEATTRIWITNAYFSPSRALISALKEAVNQGVDVQIIVPSHSDMFFFPTLTRTFYADLLAANLRIYEYRHEILHSKTMLVDHTLIIGSTNLNCRSYFHDLELDAILSNPETIQLMEAKFIADKQYSEEITLHTMRRFSKILGAFGWVSRLLRYWL